jgi:hypothetical protein
MERQALEDRAVPENQFIFPFTGKRGDRVHSISSDLEGAMKLAV